MLSSVNESIINSDCTLLAFLLGVDFTMARALHCSLNIALQLPLRTYHSWYMEAHTVYVGKMGLICEIRNIWMNFHPLSR